eukprot:SM000083S22736  [mRNA]  locus=s83:270643:273666:+ [translate_table: standard]
MEDDDAEAPGNGGGKAAAAAPAQLAAFRAPPSHALPETEALAYLLTIIFLLDHKHLDEARECTVAAVQKMQAWNRRSMDLLAARIYFYYSLSFERSGRLAEIRSKLLALHRTATLRHDEPSQEMLLNLLLRNYLHYNLYDQAEKLRSKVQRPESHSNQQNCRYLLYLGQIRTTQLEYTDAKESLLQAGRKAPAAARGFRIVCNKWAVIVQLLLGEIPERVTFFAPGMRTALRPYFELTNAVRIGDLEAFRMVAERHDLTFRADKCRNLIVRLRHNVIRTGLRRINASYSRISLSDVTSKLRLTGSSPVADTESIVTKAIRDGGIDAVVERHTKGQEGLMRSMAMGDVYTTAEPLAAFHSRIAFCLGIHNDAVKAMRFPPGAHKKDVETAEKRRERQQQEQELAKHMAEEDEDDF